MPTDELINADQDQDQINTTDLVDDAEDSFNARKASKTLNEKIEKVEKLYKEEIDTLKAKLRRFEPEAEDTEPQEDDLDTKIAKKTEEVVGRKTWYLDNKARIDSLSEESKAIFEEESKGLPLEKALRLAEYNEPYKVETREQLHPKTASVNREPKSELSESEKQEAKRLGISEKAIEIQKKIKAQRNRI